MKKKRIYLSQIQLTPIADFTPTPPDVSVSTPEISLQLQLNGEYVAGFTPTTASIVIDENGRQHTTINGYPEKTISVSIPEEDMPRVKGWFSNDYQGVTLPESDTLIKNIKNAISTLLNDYDQAAQNHNLFRMPCKFAWCAVDSNGKRSQLWNISVEHPNLNGPQLPILTHYFVGNRLYTRVQIRNIASGLYYRLGTADIIALQNAGYESIELYATKEAEYRSMKSEIYGISTININSEQHRCWIYDRFSSDEIEDSILLDYDFRKISSLRLSELSPSGDFKNLPISSALLANFKSAEKYKEGGSGSNASDNDNEALLVNNTDKTYWTHFLSEPLDLGLPEDDKHLHTAILYGIFERRNPADINLKIYGSHHREQWHQVAATHSAIIHGVRRTPYRWWRVEIEAKLRPGDKLEAITFSFSL